MAESKVSGEVFGHSTLEEISAHVSKDTFVQFLRNLADGLESGREFEVELRDLRVMIPPEGEMEIEVDQAERELELKFNWRY